MKKKYVLLLITFLCITCLIVGACTSSESVSEETSEPSVESTASESTSELLQSPEGSEPHDVPTVITRSHMEEKAGADADLLQAALDIYAEQSAKFCIMVTLEDENSTFLELACELYRNEYHYTGFPGYTEDYENQWYSIYIENYLNDLYGTFYIDESLDFCTLDQATQFFAELPEPALRAVLDCDGVAVELIDEIPADTHEMPVYVED